MDVRSLSLKVLSPLPVDRSTFFVLAFFSGVSALIVAMIFVFLFGEVIQSDLSFASFFQSPSWNPLENQFNLMPMIFGTAGVALGSLLIALPVSIFFVIFLHFYSKIPLSQLLRRGLEIMAGIPSVVYGFWGLTTLVPLVGKIEPPGANLLSASLVLSMMILPTLCLTLDDSFSNVPASQKRAAHALSFGPLPLLNTVYFPHAWPSLVTSTLLSLGRAIGETMAVLMVCGNIAQVPSSLFDPFRTLTSNIALELGYAEGEHRQALFVSGLVLLIFVTLLSVLSFFFMREKK